MANTLMFEVGVSDSVKNLDKVKKQLDDLISDYSKGKEIKLRIEIGNLKAVTDALSHIGDSQQLRNLRQEIEALNREFAKMAAGAGGTGDLGLRAAKQDAAGLKEEWQSAERILQRMRNDLADLRRSRDTYAPGSKERQELGNQVISLKKQVDEQEKVAKAAETAYKAAADGVGKVVEANTKAESSFRELKGDVDKVAQSVKELAGQQVRVNLGGDFTRWAEEVNSVAKAVRELVEQLQKMNNAAKISANVSNESLLAQAKTVDDLRTKYNKMLHDSLTTPKSAASYTAIENLPNVEKQLAAEQTRFNEMLIRGASVVGSFAEAIQQLGQKYNFTAEQAQKLAAIIASGDVSRGNVQRRLGVGYEKAGDIVETINALQKLKQEESKPAPQGGIFDSQKFTTLQEAIDKIIGEINRLKKAFEGVGEIKGLTEFHTKISGLMVDVNNFVEAVTKINGAMHIDKSAEEIAAWEKKIQELKTQYEQLQALVTSTTNTINQQTSATQNAATASKNAGNADEEATKKANIEKQRQLKLLTEVQEMYSRISSKATSGTGLNTKSFSDFRARFEELMNSLGTIPPQKSLQLLAAEFSALKTAAKSFFNEVNKEAKATESLRNVRVALKAIREQMDNGHSSPKLEALRNQLQAINREMSELKKAGKFDAVQTLFSGHKGMSDGALNIIRQVVSAIKEAEKASGSLASGQSSVASAFSKSTSEMFKQSQVLSDLKSMVMQYLSVWGAQSFIHNIIELGGQLEQQRLSIGAILQDTAQANHLFGQIKDLAIRSPFGVQQLDAMTKQLSAYGFQYSELYEWTKRLADISAATGTSVDRLALALGHVRSEGALSGYTLRQFSMGNIPLLQKLSENLGKTKQEIRKMTRNKEIGYEDVLNVLKQLTDESGMFYQAQETMAGALNAKFKNLRDSFQIMYSEMAEGAPGDFLKKVAEMLTDISKSWRVLMPMVIAGGGAFGVWRAAVMAFNFEATKTGKLMTMNALATSKYSVAQLRAIATTGRFTLAMRGLGRALMSIGKFIFNPVTLGFAAVEGLIYLWSKHNDEVRRAKDLTKAYGEEAVESEKNIAKQLENVKPFSNKLDDSALKTGIDSMTESIKNYAINGQSIINGMFSKDAEGNVMSLADKYQYLRGELEETIKVYKELKRVKDAFEYGITKSDGGWFDDDVDTDLTQYSEAYKKFVDDVTEYNSKYNNSIEKAIKNAQNSDLAFREATKNMKSYGEMLAEFWSNPNKYQNAAQFMNNLFGAGAGSDDALNLNESFFGYLNKKNEAMKELDQFIANTEERLKEKGYDFSKELAPEQVGALLKMSKEWLEKHPEWENIYDEIKSKLEGRWPIKIVPDAEAVPEQLSGWQQEIQDWLDDNGLKIQISPTDSHEDFIKKVKSLHEAAQTAMDNSGKVLIGIGFKLDNLPSELPNDLATPWNQSNLDTYNDKKSTIDKIEQLKKKFNVSWKEKGGNKGSKKNPDTERAKAVRERVRVIKEAADAFQYWREKVGDKGAWEHVQSEFGDVLAKIGITADNIEDVRKNLKKIPDTKDYKAITDKKVKTEIDKEIAKEEDQFIRNNFEKNTEKYVSILTTEIDELTRKWEIFNSVRNETGDTALAQRLAGIIPGATPADLKKYNVEKFAGTYIDFDSVLKMSDEQIDRYVEKLGVPEEKIKAIQNGLKDWKKAQQDVSTSDMQSYAKWLGSLVDLQSIRNRNQDEYNRILEETNRLLKEGQITPEEADRRRKAAQDQRDYKDWTATAIYSDLYNNAQVMAKVDFDEAFAVEMEHLKAQFKNGTITLQEYSDKVAKLNQIASEFSSRGFLGIHGGLGALLSGGTQGLSTYYRQKATQAYNRGDDEEGDKYKKRAESLEKQQKAAEQVVKAFQDLAAGADLLGNLFSSMGWEGGANAMSDASGILNGAVSGASSLSFLGPYGMAAGAALGVVSGVFALHDKSIQRQIDAIKEEVDALDANTEAIKRSRERTLGYDTGRLRRQMASQYNNTTAQKQVQLILEDLGTIDVDSAAKQAMREYYNMNNKGTGYSQELENLKKQREDYIKMYDLEDDKKKSSSEALSEYKQKIAELDDQIAYFAEDLSNELFSIDLKGWASQIGDALMTAFENGEDAAEAFKDTVKDIMRSVLNNMLTIGILEPMMENLRKKLFGENGKGGVFDANNPEGTIDAAMQEITAFFGEGGEGQQMIQATETFYKRWQEFMRSKGLTLDEEKSSSASSSIKSITEQTADLLASYVNGIRGDLSAHRAMFAQYAPMYYAALTTGNASLRNIETQTAAIMRSNDVIADKITSLDNNINGLKNKTWKLPMA